MNTTIYSISESPKNAQVIWVGTDDGNLQVTRDGGKNWTNVIGNVPANRGRLPGFRGLRPADSPKALLTLRIDRHMYGDMKPYVYKTADFGKSWAQLPTEASGVRGYAHVIKEDLVNPNLLFLGTEFGLWISVDGGQRWAQYKGSNFPAVAVRDLVVHPRTSDLVLATHGRGIWIIDDVSGLRALTPALMSEDAGFLPVPAAAQWMETNGGWPEGDAAFTGPSRTTEAFIPYYQRSRHIFGDLKIEIFDAQGKLVDAVASSKHRGVNRATWSMRVSKPPRAFRRRRARCSAPAFGSARSAGRLHGQDDEGRQDLHDATERDTRSARNLSPIEDRKKAQFAPTVNRLAGNLLNHMSWAVDAILGVRDESTARAWLDAAKVPPNDPLRVRLSETGCQQSHSDEIRSKIVATKEGGMITGEERLREYLGGLYGDVNGYEGAAHRFTGGARRRSGASIGRRNRRIHWTHRPAAAILNASLTAKKLARFAGDFRDGD